MIYQVIKYQLSGYKSRQLTNKLWIKCIHPNHCYSLNYYREQRTHSWDGFKVFPFCVSRELPKQLLHYI